jgi:hypothetical protein
VGPTLRGFGVWDFIFQNQTSTHNNSRIPKVKRKWDQHFGVSGFGISRLQKPNINTQQLPNSKKVKRSGTNTSGFRGSIFRDFKSQTSTHNNSRILKVKRKWDQHLGVSGFGISRLQKPNINTQQLPNSENEKKVGPTLWDFGVQDFATSKAKHQHTTTPEFRKVKRKWDQHFRISGFRISRLGTSCFHFVCATLLKQGSLNMNSRSCTALGKGKNSEIRKVHLGFLYC